MARRDPFNLLAMAPLDQFLQVIRVRFLKRFQAVHKERVLILGLMLIGRVISRRVC